MYATARYDGDRFDEFELYAVVRDGTKIEVDPGDLGMGYWIFRKNVLNPLLTISGYFQRNTAARRLRAQKRAQLWERVSICDDSGQAGRKIGSDHRSLL
jgi:hypothetical protein